MPSPSPATDTLIARKYDAKTLEGKLTNKITLQEELGWPAEPKIAMVCLPMGMTDALGGEVLRELIPGLMTLPLQLVILGKGGASYGKMFTQLTQDYPHRVAIIGNDEETLHRLYAGSDIALFLAPTENASEVRQCLRYGTVPVGMEGGQLENYNPNQESGNAFTFEEASHWHAFAALVRALETYRFPYDWKTIQRHCMDAAK